MSSHTNSRPRDRNAFEVAIICALPLEADATIALFDESWECDEQYAKSHSDTNTYTLGRLGAHNVVLVHMSRMGKGSAADVAANLRSSFPHIRLTLLVGICGGVPFIDHGGREVTLGDIVISTQIIQTDFGRLYPNAFIRKNTPQDNLGRPRPEIAGFLSCLQGQSARTKLENQIRIYLNKAFGGDGLHPGVCEDQLFETNYRHKHQDIRDCTICAESINPDDSVCEKALNASCAELGCDAGHLKPRARIQNAISDGNNSHNPVVHFGAVASGDQVIKSAQHRDRIAEQEGVIAFEMEGAGLWESIPTIVVKGVCDYADSHKNKEWQLYAAATAAACAKGMLRVWRPAERQTERPAKAQHQDPAPFPQTIHQSFTGHFNAQKGIHNGGTYKADTMNF
jgi:nucleoside phosphorylase